MTNKTEKLLETLKADRAALLEKSAPLRKARDEIVAKIQPEENRVRELGKEIAKIEQPHLADLDKQIATLEKALKK